MANAKRSGGADNLCEVVDNHATLIDQAVVDVTIPTNGQLQLELSDGTIETNSIPFFNDFVISGLATTQQASPNLDTFDYSGGTYQINGVLYTATAGSASLAAGDATFSRFDVIYVNSSGVAVQQGTASGSPEIPAVPPASISILTILVGAGADGTGGYNPVTSLVGVNEGATIGNTLVWDGAQWVQNGVFSIYTGLQSARLGEDAYVTGIFSFAGGGECGAVGDYGFAFGADNTIANGDYSTALGESALANGDNSTAIGKSLFATGNNSFACGHGNTTESYAELKLGSYSTGYTATSTTTVSTLDRVLTIGNGTSGSPSDATRIWKSGYHEFNGTIKIGETTAGTGSTAAAGQIRWDGTNFQGYDGTSWLNLNNVQAYTQLDTGTNANTVITPITTSGTYESIRIDSSVGFINVLQDNFTQGGTTSLGFNTYDTTYNGTETKVFELTANLTFTCSNNNEYSFRWYKNGAAVGPVFETEVIGANIATQATCSHLESLATNDTVELQVTNISAANDITVRNMVINIK